MARAALLAVLCLAAVAASAFAAVTAPRKLVLLRGVPETEAQSLANKFDVRGIFGDLTLLIATPAELASLREAHPNALDVATYDRERTVVVLEKQELAVDTEASVAKWARDMRTLVDSDDNLRVIFALPRRLVVLVREGDIAALKDLALPGDTEVLPMLAQRLRTPSEARTARLQRLRKTYKTVERQADIPALLAQVNQTTLRSFIEYLSGESAGSPILTRNSYAVGSGVTLAANYLQQQYAGFGFSAAQESFRTDMGPNVIATLRGAVEPNVYVVMGAHYDSRSTSSTSTTQRAPGANDDGSGTGALLQIAKIISENRLSFRYSVILGSWCGEEQGLVGSRAYAAKSRNNDLDILAMLQADMIAYRASGEAAQCAFPNRNADQDLTDLSIELVNTYVPAVRTCYTSACCSDHQSFTEQGYAATQLFERCGSIADVQYHQSGDLVNRANYDLNQLALNTQAMLANLLVLAEVL